MNPNIPIFRSTSSNAGARTRMDSNDLFFFTNELTHYDPKEFPNLKNDLTAFEVFNIKSVDPAMSVYTYSMNEGTGAARYAAAQQGKNNDFPYVGAKANQFSSPMFEVISALAFSQADLLASQSTRRDIVATLKRQAMRSNFELMNKTCFQGNINPDIPGLLNNPHIDKGVVKSGNAPWSGKKSEDILKDLTESYNAVLKATSNLIRPNTMLIASSPYNEIDSRIFNSFNGTTIAKQFTTQTGVKIIHAPELNESFSGKDGFVLFKNDPDIIQHVVATLFETTPPQAHALEHRVFCYSKHGGIIIRQPKSIVIRHGC